MRRKYLPHVLLASVVIGLFAAIVLLRRSSPSVSAPITEGLTPPAAPAAMTHSTPPDPAQAPSTEPRVEVADPNEKVDPARVLRAELLVHVLRVDGSPIAGAEVFPSLSTNPWNGEEGILSDDLMGGGAFTAIKGKNAIFRGTMMTNAEGEALLQIFLPRQERYLKGYLVVSVEAPLMVHRKHRGQLRLPQDGERKEITFRLQPGQIIRGKILNLEDDDVESLWVELLLPGEEKKDRKTWFAVPKLKADGTFESEPAPMAQLLLHIDHPRDKYLPYNQPLSPPVERVQEIVLQRDAEFRKIGRAVFTVVNPPAKGKFDHAIRLYCLSRKSMDGMNYNTRELTEKRELHGGSYQAILCSFDQDVPMWAHAEFTVADGEKVAVPLTLEKCASVRIRLRDRSTGAPVDRKDMPGLYVRYRFGDTYQNLFGRVLGYGNTKTAAGETLLTTIPPGALQLVVGDSFERQYRECPQDVALSPGESQILEFNLEPLGKADQDR